MKLTDLLAAIELVADKKGLSRPYIVGGLARDKLLQRIRDINDVDITTGDESIYFLSKEVARLLEGPNTSYKVMDDGHSKLIIDGFQIDFSSNFTVPNIELILQKGGIENPTEMQKELYSRDFTCNAALMTMDLKKILDPTGLAVEDIRNNIIKTCLTPELTLDFDNKRVVRAIYLAAKLDFELSDNIKDWIAENPKSIMTATPGYVTKKLKKAAEFNPEKTKNLLSELSLWKYIPSIPELSLKAVAKKKKKRKKKKDKKRVDMDVRPYPNPFFRNYDYGGPEGGSEVSPGTGLYHGKMDKYKSVKDFLDKARERKHRKRALRVFAAVLDLTDKLKEKKEKEEEVERFEKLKEAPQAEVLPPQEVDELTQMREQKSQEKVKSQFGSWQHRFSDVRKDESGFYILPSDNTASNKMRVGDTLADSTLNMTPYWKVSSISADRIFLEPIGKNPFITGVGAGGARLTEHDIGVFTGEYEQKRIKNVQEKLRTGDARIDDVIYLLDGTVPVQMGPNGAQGGWYNADDSRNNRGGRKGLTPEQIVVFDANRLKDWGFAVPISAIKGEMDPADWSKWIEGNGTSDIDYIPKDLEKYIDFHRQMTQEGKYSYTESGLDKLRRDLSEEHAHQYWEGVAKDVVNLSQEEFDNKYKYYDKSLKYVVEALERNLEDIRKKKKKLKQYFVEGEEDTEESVLKSVFHPERRVAVRNVMRLIGLSQEDPKYRKYLHDYVRMGGNDWLANEKVIQFFDDIDDIKGLKLAAENFHDPDNQRYALGYLFDKGEEEFAKKHLEDQNDFQVIDSILGRVMKQEAGDYYPREKIGWIIDYVKKNNLFNEIEASIPLKTRSSYFADELLHTIIKSYGIPDFLNDQERAELNAWINLRKRLKEERFKK